MKRLLTTFGLATLLSTPAWADDVPVYAWIGTTAAGGFEFVLLDEDDAMPLPLDAPLLLASVAVDAGTPGRASDSWWSKRAPQPPREPTDPDSPGLPILGSPLETPWDAWENRDDLRGEWESMDPGDW